MGHEKVIAKFNVGNIHSSYESSHQPREENPRISTRMKKSKNEMIQMNQKAGRGAADTQSFYQRLAMNRTSQNLDINSEAILPVKTKGRSLTPKITVS